VPPGADADQAASTTKADDDVMARLNRLPTVRVMSQLGAVIGWEFDDGLLRTLPGSPVRLHSELALQTTLGRVLAAANR
jgi:hypothetical protein